MHFWFVLKEQEEEAVKKKEEEWTEYSWVG